MSNTTIEPREKVQDKSATLTLMNAWQTERRIVEAIAALSQVSPLNGRAATLHNSVLSRLTGALANARELLDEL